MAILSGKAVLVTGGGSGIGRAAALLLAREGAQVIVTGTNPEAGCETVRLISEAGGQGDYVRADLSRDEDIDALFASIEHRYGRLDGAFNNAGTSGLPTPILEATVALYDQICAVNSRAVWLCMQRELRLMRALSRGSIVNTSSVHGTLGMAERSAYVASKHAVIGMTRAVALEMARSNIRVNCLCPGATKSRMFERWASEAGEEAVKSLNSILPIGRPADPEEMAAPVLWLLSDASSYMTGQTLIVDGGFSIA